MRGFTGRDTAAGSVAGASVVSAAVSAVVSEVDVEAVEEGADVAGSGAAEVVWSVRPAQDAQSKRVSTRIKIKLYSLLFFMNTSQKTHMI